MEDKILRLAIPSDGELYQSTLTFLSESGLPVQRSSPRSYTGIIKGLPNTTVLFQRTADIPIKVGEGSADIGITGLDRFLELGSEEGDTDVIIQALGFGNCELVMAVPDSWLDVDSIYDLADLSTDFRERGIDLRIATKYPRLVQRHLYVHGVNYFSLIQSSGTLEAAPAMGFADIIADISSSGTTIRENHLKTIEGGSILTSQACIIANKKLLSGNPDSINATRLLLEYVEAYIRARDFYTITANINGSSPEEISENLIKKPEISGIKGPTISRVYSDDNEIWYSVTMVVPRDVLPSAISHIRNIGGGSVTVAKAHYVFEDQCNSYEELINSLKQQN